MKDKKVQKTQRKRNHEKAYAYSFKADKKLDELLSKVNNKSQFIKDALMIAFAENNLVDCPLCKGQGKIQRIKKRVTIHQKTKEK